MDYTIYPEGKTEYICPKCHRALMESEIKATTSGDGFNEPKNEVIECKYCGQLLYERNKVRRCAICGRERRIGARDSSGRVFWTATAGKLCVSCQDTIYDTITDLIMTFCDNYEVSEKEASELIFETIEKEFKP